MVPRRIAFIAPGCRRQLEARFKQQPVKNHTFGLGETILVLALTASRSLAQSTYEPYTFTTLAGSAGLNSPDTPGSAARFLNPLTVAVDSAGNLYVAEQGNHSISKVTPAGAVTTLAGRPGSFGSANGTAGIARLNGPSCAALDNAGNVY